MWKSNHTSITPRSTYILTRQIQNWFWHAAVVQLQLAPFHLHEPLCNPGSEPSRHYWKEVEPTPVGFVQLYTRTILHPSGTSTIAKVPTNFHVSKSLH